MRQLVRILLAATGLLATGLAILGALLPGLPATPFVLVALWAFARSSPRLARALEDIPLLGHALAEARRFEARRRLRWQIKALALGMAWSSFLLTALVLAPRNTGLTLTVGGAALLATAAMIWIPTDRD